ncbi:MAG: ketoacyl-ACP synthase III [Oscillospiraceae bacterium]|nr:ketoacyl-ACP synthase III [Oscillospiraceae bacterium]
MNLSTSNIKILGTGSFKPDFVALNEDFSKTAGLETDDDWITSRTGIKQRMFNCGENATNYNMSSKAAERALKAAGISADDIDIIVASTATPDFFYPSLACLVQNAIGATNAFAIDVSAACTGFVNALDIVRNYLANGSAKKALIVSGEMLSYHTDFTDRATCVLFGDGAGAIVLEATDSPKLYAAHLGAIGEKFDEPALYCKVPYKCNSPFGAKGENFGAVNHVDYIQMDGRAVYKFASDIMPKTVKSVCEKAGLELSDIDLLIPHQANIRIIKTAMKNLDIPEDKVYVNIEKTGNISSACIPVCLDELYELGRIKAGMKICMVAFGAGLTYGAVIIEV